MVKYFSAIIFLLLALTDTQAQGTGRIPRVAILIPESLRSESQVIRGLREELKKLGYKERKNIHIEVLNAKGDRAALKSMASEIVSRKVNLLLTTGTRATHTAQAATKEIPIIFSHPADPVALGLVKSMDHPGGNTTGVAGLALRMTEKRLEALKEIVPKVRRVAIFYDANNPYSRENFLISQSAGAKLGLQIEAYPVKSAEELKSTLSQLQNPEGDALFHVADDLVESQADFLFEMARQKALPTMFNEEMWAIKGSLAAYGPSYYQMGRQAAVLVDKVLKGQKPMNLPVQQVSKFELVINFRVANAMGLTIPQAVLKKADKVIR